MSPYVFSKEAENNLVGIYRYGFINYGENMADLYIEALKEKCLKQFPYRLNIIGQWR